MSASAMTVSGSNGYFASPNYQPRTFSVAPSNRAGGMLVYDAAHAKTFLFGGYGGSGTATYLNDTWSWDGRVWTQLSPSTSPGVRKQPIAAYDPVSQKIIMFGGRNSTTALSDTWSFDGGTGTWTSLAPSTSPSARYAGAAAYSNAAGKLVLFGGASTSNTYNQETWTFDPSTTTWSQLSLSTKPSARGFMSMAQDESRNQLVLFGGLGSGSSSLGDTWFFSGTAWSQLSTSVAAPSVRQDYGMAYDPILKTVIIVGGYDNGANSYKNSTYLYDGTDWEQAGAYVAVSSRQQPMLAQTKLGSGHLMLLGGFNGSSIYGDQYSYDYGGLGLRSYYTMDNHPITDREAIAVNVASGNLLVSATDLSVRGIGLSVGIHRNYNSEGWVGGVFRGNWSYDIGSDVYLSAMPDGSLVLFGMRGGDEAFFGKPTSTTACPDPATPGSILTGSSLFGSPPGWNADLCLLSSGAVQLVEHSSQTIYNFNSAGQETSIVDRNGNTISISYLSGGSTNTITDTSGRAITFSYNTDGTPSQIQDSTGRTVTYGYNSSSFLTSFTDANSKTTTYGYDSNNNLTSITDPDGRKTTLGPNTHAAYGQITRITDTANQTGPTTLYDFDRPLASTDASSGVRSNVMRKMQLTDQNNHASTEYSNQDTAILETVDANNNTRSGGFTTNGDVSSLTDGLSAVTTLAYNTDHNLTSITSPAVGANAAATTLAYNTPSSVGGNKYLPSSTTDAQNNCKATTYDNVGNLTDVYDGQATGCDGQVGGTHLANRYQGGTSVASCTSDGLTTTYKGILCSSTDGNGGTTSYAYTFNSTTPKTLTQLVVTQPGGTCTAPRNLCTTTTFDALTRVATVTDSSPANSGAGVKTTYCYDNNDRITSLYLTAPSTTPTCGSGTPDLKYTYDGHGNLTSRVDPTGPTSYTYDLISRPTRISAYPQAVQADSPVSYWKLGETSGTTATDAQAANNGTYTNAPTLNQTPLITGENVDRSANFDGTNDHVTVPSATSLNFGTTFSLEAWIKADTKPSSAHFASVLTKAEAYSLQFNGPQLEFTVMQSGVRQRLQASSGTIATGTTYHVVATYDGANQRLYVNGTQVASRAQTGAASTNTNALKIGSWDGTTEYFDGTIDDVAVYNTTLTATQVAEHYSAGNTGLAYTYDWVSNLVGFTDASGTTNYTYDNVNNLKTLVEPGGTSGCAIGTTPTLTTLCTAFAYDANNRRTTTQYPGGARQTITYDAAGNETNIVGESYDPASTPKYLSVTNFSYCYRDLSSGSCPTSGTGTDRNKLTQQIENDPRASLTTNYLYDGFGRLCAASSSSGGSCATPPSGANVYRYDNNGNRTTSTVAATTTYSGYNAANELCWTTTVSNPGNSACASAPSGATTYGHDGNGNLTTVGGSNNFTYNTTKLANQTTGVTAGGTTLSAIAYADLGQAQRLRLTQAGVTTTFVNDPRGVNKTATPTTSTYTIRDPSGNLIGHRDGAGGHWYFMLDRLGSIVALTSADGLSVGNRYAYDEWGRSTYACTTLCVSVPVQQQWGYAGGQVDPTGLVKFGARYYDPSLGRWTQLDPSGQDAGYTYVGDDPCNRSDPSGLHHNGYTPCRGFWYERGVRFLSAGSWLRTGYWWAKGNTSKARSEFWGSLASSNKWVVGITKVLGPASEFPLIGATVIDGVCAMRQAEYNDQGWVNQR